MQGARGVLFNITGGPDLTMSEVDEAAKIIASEADPDANIIFGAMIDDSMHDQIKITVIATGFDQTRQRLSEYVIPEKKTEETSPNQPAAVKEPAENDEDVFEIPAFLRNRN